jgi:hypothetical protein
MDGPLPRTGLNWGYSIALCSAFVVWSARSIEETSLYDGHRVPTAVWR